MDHPGPGGIYRPLHPQDPQSVPPPNFQTPGMQQRDQGMNGNMMYRNSQQIPSRLSSGYHPPRNDTHMSQSGIPIMSSQDQQGMPAFPGYIPGQGAPRGYPHSSMSNPVSGRPSQNSSRFRQDVGSNSNSHSFHSQQHMPSSHSSMGVHQSRGSYHQGGHNPSDYHHIHQQHTMGGQQSQSHSQQPEPKFNSPGDRSHQKHGSNHPGSADFHHPQSSMMGHNFHPQRHSDFSHNGQMSHPDFQGYMDLNTMGMQNMMLGEQMMGAGDGYPPHQYPMYDHDVRDSEFVCMGHHLMDKQMQSSIASVNFDTHQELVWAGNQRGCVASYFGPEFQKYSSFRMSMDEDVRMNLSFPQGVLSLTPTMLQGTLRRGIPVFSFKDAHFHDMQCMMMRGEESVLIGGPHKQVLEVDIIRNCLSNVFEVGDAGVAIFRDTDKFLCGGDSTGKVTVYDRLSMRRAHILDSQTSCLSDFDIHDNLLITCGFSNRMNTLTPDRQLRVYDMRMMKMALAPIQVNCDPTFLRFLPTMPNHAIVVSQIGSFQLVDLLSGVPPTQQPVYPINTNGSAVIAFDVSSTYQSLAFGDSSGNVHLYSHGGQNSVFNQYSVPIDLSEPVEHIDPLDLHNDPAIYASIPAQQYPGHGHPEFPDHMMKQLYRNQHPMGPDTMRNMDNSGYTTNMQKKRNTYELKKGANGNRSNNQDSKGDDPFLIVPKRYRRLDIKYTKFDMEELDIRNYNKTNMAGLEPHLPNTYCNSMLQVLYFLEPLRAALLGYVSQREFCLASELGFLFHMLDSQKGKTCQATNFLRAFRAMPRASDLGLVLHNIDKNRQDLPALIQSWQRFVLKQIHEEISTPADGPQEEQKSKLSNEEKKGKKKSDSPSAVQKDSDPASMDERQSIVRDLFGIVDLVYPDYKTNPNLTPFFMNFAEVVQNSMTPTTNIQDWCQTCNGSQQQTQRQNNLNLPDVLALHCHTENENNLEFWKSQFNIVRERFSDSIPSSAIIPSSNQKKCRFGNSCHRVDCVFAHDGPRACDAKRKQEPKEDDKFGVSWIPMGLRVEKRPDGSVDVIEISDEEPLPDRESDSVRYYELHSVVSNVQTPCGSNLVCTVKGGEPYHQRKEHVTCTQWYLMNDFCITPVEKEEAVDFKLDWNVPCIIQYIRRNFISNYDTTVQRWSSPDVLYNDTALMNPERRNLTFRPLQPEELPKKGDIVALDAEFVSLKEEEKDSQSDGNTSTNHPAQMSVARITCVRGSGPNQGEPFIDDYMNTQSQRVQSLSQWASIKAGDLDVGSSTKHLTTLKSTYQKLRYLVDTGVIFVGHGLKKDFRAINLLVPPTQVVDTAEIYHLPKQRYISLKYLASHFLKMVIQSHSHDSTEDAKTALNLYLKYKEKQAEDKEKFRSCITELYETGRKHKWQVKAVDGDVRQSEQADEETDLA